MLSLPIVRVHAINILTYYEPTNLTPQQRGGEAMVLVLADPTHNWVETTFKLEGVPTKPLVIEQQPGTEDQQKLVGPCVWFTLHYDSHVALKTLAEILTKEQEKEK